MTINEIYSNFCDSIAEIVLLQRNTRTVMKKEIESLYNRPLQQLNNMFFTDFRTQEEILFACKSLFPDEHIEFMRLKFNRDYQFYLASAYEKFEDTIELIYAYLGKSDVNFWPLSEFGQEHYDNVKKLNFDFYVDRAKKCGAIKIFKNLIKKFNCNIKTNIADIQTEIILIEKLRHIIVHNSGCTTNKEDFIHTVARDAGIFNNGNIDVDIYKYIENFFGKNKYDKLVSLLDVHFRLQNGMITPFSSNIFEKLIGKIVFAVYVICEKSEEYIKTIPISDRQNISN